MKKPITRRDFLKLSAATGAGLALAACAPKVLSEEPGASSTAPAVGKPTSSSEKVKVNYWNGFVQSDGEIMVDIVKRFSQENPDVEVNMQSMEWGVYFDKLAAALVAGSGGPDLMVFWHGLVPQYALQGHIRPAAQEMFDLGLLDKNDFNPALVDAVTLNGQSWTIPLDNYGCGVYINTDLIKKAGLDINKPPKDQAEFLEYATALTWDKKGKHPGEEGFDPNNVEIWGWAVDEWSRIVVQPALYQWGGDIISRETPPKVLINSQGSKDALQFFTDCSYKYFISPPKPAGFTIADAYAQGKVAMWPMGSWMYNWFNQHPEVPTSIWPYPRLGPVRGATIMWSHTMAMPTKLEGAKLDATRRLVKFISDHSDLWTLGAGMPTARLSLQAGLTDKVWTLPSFASQFKEEGVMEFTSPKFLEILGAVEPEWSAARNQVKTVDDAMNAAAESVKRILG